ncbi:MAG TPA: polymer-forming cytoskeletal protein [Longimicrobiaceae bacterium]|jgi:hypothetical protein
MTPSRLRLLFLAALASCALALPLRAQDVRVEGAADSRAVRIAREVLAAGNYLRMDRDTVLPADFRTAGDLVVVDADVRLEGTVEGRIAVFGGVLFIRPGARVTGPIVNLGGEVYPSGLAQVGEVVEAEPELRVGVEFDTAGARVRVALPDRGLAFKPFGFRLPTYDRVNGLTVALGPSLLFTGDPEGPRVDAWVSYRTARSSFGGGVSGSAPLGRWRVDARVERATLTNDAWARGDLANTLGALVFANDYRDYWESDRAAVTLSRPHSEAIIAGEYAWEPRVTLMAMRDRSLRNRDPWSLFDDFERENPPVDELEWASATVGAGFRWQGSTTEFAGDAAVERALPLLDGADFTQWTVDGLWAMQALYLHQIGVRFRAMGTLGGEAALRQRRTLLGGAPTLPTFPVGAFSGDNLAFVQSTYAIPLPQRLALPIIGPPSLRFTHVAGAAWTTGGPMPLWEQNLGAGLAFSFASAELFIDPAGDLEPTLRLGLELPSF